MESHLEVNRVRRPNVKEMMFVASNGVLLAFILSGIFLVAKFLGYEQVVWLRFINYIIFFPIAYKVISKVYHEEEKLNYFHGLMLGFLTCLTGQLLFTLLFFIYLHFDDSLMSFIISQMPGGFIYPELSTSFVLFSEGIAWSVITAFALMQVFKWKRGRWGVHA